MLNPVIAMGLVLLYTRLVSAHNHLPTARIEGGLIIGTTTSLPSATAVVNKFLGVPFAASPVRFTVPTKAPSWLGEYDASSIKPACIQQFNYPESRRDFITLLFNTPAPDESEDCLYLNVFAPSTLPPAGGFPVLFWLYGGSLEFGDAGHPLYDGAGFAGYENVILVSVNYRTGVFGFASSPEIPIKERNLGMLDQRFALQWTQNNIKAFGGDPSKVTIMGESAGAVSVDALLTSYTEQEAPFRGGILESGQVSLRGSPAPDGIPSWYFLASQLNCSSGSSNLTCIRDAPAGLLKNISEINRVAWPVASDNLTIIDHPVTLRASRNISNVPLLVGTNNNEGSIYVMGQNNLTLFLNTNFATIPTLEAAMAQVFAVDDGKGNGGYASDAAAIDAIYTHYVFQCPQAIMASQTVAAGSPVWRYYFNATFPNTQTVPGLQVYHSSEISLVFGTYPKSAATDQQIQLSKYMRKAWADFAKNPTAGPGWDKLGTTGVDLAVLGLNGSVGSTMVNESVVDSKCAIFAPVYNFFSS